MSRTKSNPGIGKHFYFFGAFRSKILAARAEREHPGSFILRRGSRWYVLKQKTKRNPRSTHSGFQAKGFWTCGVCGKSTIHIVHGKPIHKKCYEKLKQTRTLKPNPARGTLIYGRVLKIFAQKTSGPFKGQRFVHTFKPGAIMVGLPDGSIRISHP